MRGPILIRVTAFLLVAFFAEREVHAQVFREDFDGTALDPAVWQVDSGDGAVTVANGRATLTGAGATPPVVFTRHDPFPPGDFAVLVGAQYNTVAFCGDGFGALDNFYPFYPQGCRPFLLWQDSQGWYVYSGGIGNTGLGPQPETGFHEYEWRYIAGRYDFYLDGVWRAGESCAPRAMAFFFGHPHPVSCLPWTSFSLDFVEIRPIGVTTAARSSWGALKMHYR